MSRFRWSDDEAGGDAGPGDDGPPPTWTAAYPETVAANRDGRIAPAQRAVMLRSAAWRLGGAVVCGAGLALAAAGIGGPAWNDVGQRNAATFALFLATAALLVIGAPPLLDALRGRVTAVEGPIGVEEQSRGGIRVKIGERSFAAPPGMVERLRTGSAYRLYAAPVSRRVLNWELLDVREVQAAPVGPIHAQARRCSACGALARSPSERTCHYCGAELPW